MTLVDEITTDAKTGITTRRKREISFPALPPEPKGLDLEKLKDVLLAKGIITNKGEVE